MTNLSEFLMMFSSCAIIHFIKDALGGQLFQTINNVVDKNKSCLIKKVAAIPTHHNGALGRIKTQPHVLTHLSNIFCF